MKLVKDDAFPIGFGLNMFSMMVFYKKVTFKCESSGAHEKIKSPCYFIGRIAK